MKVTVIKVLDITGREVFLDAKSILYGVKSLGDDFLVHGKTIEEATKIIDEDEKRKTKIKKQVEDNGKTKK